MVRKLVSVDGATYALPAPVLAKVKTDLSATFDAGNAKTIYVGPGGSDAHSGLLSSKPKATLAAALIAMGSGVKGTIRLLPGDISAGTGVSWTGYRCGLVGSDPLTTRIFATAQTGAVIDLSGVAYNMDGVEFGGFTIHGDGTAGAAKKGLVLSSALSMTTSWIHDIQVRYTGGTCFDLGITEVSTIERLVAFTPVSAATSDIPYVTATGAFNGNLKVEVTLIGTEAAGVASAGVSGAVVITDNGQYSPNLNNFRIIPENICVPSGGTLVSVEGSMNTIEVIPFDCSKVAGAVNTAHLRLEDAEFENGGGNLVHGIIPGKDDGLSVDAGVDVRQSRNRIVGVKGYNGTNVILALGVAYTHIELGGANSGASAVAVVDNSGNNTNTYSDQYLGTATDKGVKIARFEKESFTSADTHYLRNITGTKQFVFAPQYEAGLTLPDHEQGLPVAAAPYRGKVALKLGVSNVADRLVICRKDATNAYAWVDLY